MKFTKFLAILLISVLLNSHILAHKDTITISRRTQTKRSHKIHNHSHRTFKKAPETKIENGLSIQVDRSTCKEEMVNWEDFLMAVFSKINSNFSSDLITMIKGHVDEYVHSNALFNECKKEFRSLYEKECELYRKDLEILAQEKLSKIVETTQIHGLTKDQSDELMKHQGNPQAICKFSKKLSETKIKSAKEWTEAAKIDIELLNLAIEKKWTLMDLYKMSIVNDFWNGNIKKNFYSLVMNYVDLKDSPTVRESKIQDIYKKIKQDLEESMTASKNIHEKALNALSDKNLTTAPKNTKEVKLNDTEKLSEINCDDLPQKVDKSYTCLKIGVATKFRAFWSMFSREKKDILPKCIFSMIPDKLVKLLIKVPVDTVLGLISNFLGLILFNATYYSLKIIWYMYKSYSHHKLMKKFIKEKKEQKNETKLKEIEDKIKIELTKKSENLGKATGTLVRMILSTFNDKKRKFKF
jgi:hypothetical protein